MSRLENEKDLRGLAPLEEKLKYTFQNKNLLMNALIHSSYTNEHHTAFPSNERLEFLGDSVLSLISAEFLYGLTDKDEGYLTRAKAKVVCESALCKYSEELSLGEYLLFGKGDREEGKHRPSTIADAFEAVLGAIYLDSGFIAARDFALPYLRAEAEDTSAQKDYKTLLQEVVQKNRGEKLDYKIISEQGPAHERVFTCGVYLNSNSIGKGEGSSKKNAEQMAAKQALSLMGIA